MLHSVVGTRLVVMNANPQLVQKRLFETREFLLREQDIHLVVKDTDGVFETDIPLENITDTRRRRVQAKGRLLSIGISFGVFAGASLVLGLLGFEAIRRFVPIWSLVSLISTVWYYVSRKEYVLLETEGNASIYFMAKRPSPEGVKEFIDRILHARNDLLKRKYAKIFAENSLEDELERLQDLFRRGIITREELDRLQAQLMLRSSKPEDSRFVN